MAQGNALIQVNFKPTATMINGYAADVAELDEILSTLNDRAGAIFQTEAMLVEAAKAAGVLQAAGVAPRSGGGQSAPQGGGGGGTPVPSCQHGPQKLYVGADYWGWMCTAGRDSGCPKPRWTKTKDAPVPQI